MATFGVSAVESNEDMIIYPSDNRPNASKPYDVSSCATYAAIYAPGQSKAKAKGRVQCKLVFQDLHN
ncbi:hypothetical protein PAXRUDRAFT_18382 [Paxillus rubicundulus Ve08.2h10]|uniref:Uncharacterized protein n=1 Tax=Paxillus rubicundulus Ve08.2h10 TaxID=930991 RepID=A0A0D0CLM8_9AGAM|nr:hypothetical protein PAXRUDRAFT_18382 [Paxillus rubicundulus Ve08.2h10]